MIRVELQDIFGIPQCTSTGCQFITRHFRERNNKHLGITNDPNGRYSFYIGKFDSLHFHIYHLEQSGYRYRKKLKSKPDSNLVDDDESKLKEPDDDNHVDKELEEAVMKIKDDKEKCDYGRFQSGESECSLFLRSDGFLFCIL